MSQFYLGREIYEYTDTLPSVGLPNRIYIVKSTNTEYRWDTGTNTFISVGDGGADTSIIYEDYDPTATYPTVGSYCIKDGVLYVSITPITTAEAWNSSHWTSTNVMNEISGGLNTKAPIDNPSFTGSISMNRNSETTVGENSVAAGGTNVEATGARSAAFNNGKARANNAFACGSGTASGVVAHAEGSNTTASGAQAHAEGGSTIASGQASHAEGLETEASGHYSHAQGVYTIAKHYGQSAAGWYNVADPSTGNVDSQGTYAEIIGNGTADNARSNARALDWAGNERLKGDIYVGCNADSTGGTALGSAITTLNGKIENILLSVEINTNDSLKTKLASAISSILTNYTLQEGKSYPVMMVFLGSNLVGSFTGTINITSGGIRFVIGTEDRIFHGLYLRSTNTISSVREIVGTAL